MKAGSSAASGATSGTMKPKHSKAIGMRFYWLKDRSAQGQLSICWDSGKRSLGGCQAKRHPPTHHSNARCICTFAEGLSPEALQGRAGAMSRGAEPKRERKRGAPSAAPKGIPKVLGLPLSRIAKRLLSST